MNPLAQYDVAVGGSTGRTSSMPGGSVPEDWEVLYDSQGQPVKWEKKKKDSSTGKNGKKVEKSRNGNIVKAIKNL
jgi:hypothetical protein